jgi:hypothetical protein
VDEWKFRFVTKNGAYIGALELCSAAKHSRSPKHVGLVHHPAHQLDGTVVSSLDQHGMLSSIPRVGVFILRNNREVDITQGFCPEAGSPLCCRFISEENFRDLQSPNGYISGKPEGMQNS